MSRRLRRWTHKFAGESGYQRIAGDLEVQGNIIGPSMSLISTAIDKIVAGTTTPVKLVINKCEGAYKAIILQWVAQYNLMNFDHYELQVSEDNTAWYSLAFDGTTWAGVLNADTDVVDAMMVHTPIPFLGTAEAPMGRKLYYRMRQKTIMGTASAWSDVVSATTSTVETGDLAANSIYANNMRVGELKARELAFADDVYGNAHEYPDNTELFDLGQPDCLSSSGRIPSVRETVFAPGEIEDELGNKYLGLHAPRFIGQSGAIFGARTNLVVDPENLTTANWADWGVGATELLSGLFSPGNQQYTKITAGAVWAGRSQVVTFTTDAVKSYQCWLRRGSETSTSAVGIYDATAAAWMGYITVDWTTQIVVAGLGTLMDYEWNGNDEVWISGVTTPVDVSNTNHFVVCTITNGAYVYFTALQAENAAWPSPYIDRTRWISQTRPAVSSDYAVTMPGKFLFKIKLRPWFYYTSGIYHTCARWYVDATSYFKIQWDFTTDKFYIVWRDDGNERILTSSAFTTNVNQELILFGAVNLDSGGIGDSRFVVFLENGTKFSEDITWDLAPDVKASTFPTLSLGHAAAAIHADSVISYIKLWDWDGAALGTINTEADVDAIVDDKTSLFDLELEPYATAYQPINKQGAIGIFPATTNLVTSPEDLTNALWVNEGAATDALSDYYIAGKRFTLFTAGAADTGVYQILPLYTGATTKGVSCWMRRGTSATSYIYVYDTIATTERLRITVTWATKTVACATGTLRDALWVSDDLVWVSGVSTAVTTANLHRIYCRPTTAAATAYFTAIQTENIAWPTPYTPTTRTAGQLTYKMPAGLPDKFSLVCWIRPWFLYTDAVSTAIWSWYIDATHQLNCYYDPATDMFTISWIDGGTGRVLVSQQFGGAFDTLNQWIMLAVSIDLSTGGITTGSFFKTYATSILKDSAWSGNIDAKTSTFPTFHIGWQAATFEAQSFISDLMFLPGVLLTEEACDRHYNMTRPWYSPTEAAAGNRSVRIDKSGIRMHNAGLTISDNLNRLIDISNRTGLLAKDAAGKIIHDIPNAPILTDMIYGGHVLWREAPDYISSIISLDYTDTETTRAASSAITNVDLSTFLPTGMTNARGVLAYVRLVPFASAAKMYDHTTLQGSAQYSTKYNTAPPTGAFLVHHRQKGWPDGQEAYFYASGSSLIPIVFDGSTPYLTWRVAIYFANMNPANDNYRMQAYLYILGVLV